MKRYQKVLAATVALVALGALASCEQKPSAEQLQCESDGGEWAPFGLLGTMVCYPHYDDAGKSCTNSTQCQGLCEVEYNDNNPSGGGVCAATIMSGCTAFFNETGEFEEICVD